MTLEQFKAWLLSRGATIEPSTSEWELVRYRLPSAPGVQIIYRNKKERQTYTGTSFRDWESAYHQVNNLVERVKIPSQPLNIRERSNARRELIVQLRKRDGDNCFYCTTDLFNGEIDPTIEHLIPKAHKGSNHIGNLVLACEPCNQRAGDLPLIQKHQIS